MTFSPIAAATAAAETAAYKLPNFVAGASLVQDIAVLLLAAAVAAVICKRMGLSVIVGYLLAAIVIGPNTPMPLVGDSHRIAELSELGLVFVMFSIGLHLSLTKLASMGAKSIVATALGALFMLQFTLMLGGALDWSPKQSLFVAAMLMVSSSAVIAKVMEELRIGHNRTAQMALGMTILEDIVAVVMLTVLAAQTSGGSDAAGQTGLAGLFTNMGAFIVLLVSAGLLFMPRLLRRFDAAGDPEVRIIAVAGLLLLLAFCAMRAGYSLALGAFLFGAIVAELPQKESIEKSFSPLRSVFSAIFFVSIGMLIKPAQLADSWLMTGSLTLFSLFVRPLACGFALMLVGVPPREARRGGLLLTPLGEFTFIIAQAGITAGVLGEEFYPTAVALSIFTVLATPIINRHAEPILNLAEKLEPAWFRKALAAYHAWLAHFGASGAPKPAWAIVRRKLAGMAVEALFVTGLLVYSRPLHDALLGEMRPAGLAEGRTWAYAAHFDYAFWGIVLVLALVPLVAMWRTASALALMLAQSADPRVASPKLVERGVMTLFALLLAEWLYAILPVASFTPWGWALLGALAVAIVAVFSNRLIFWHSSLHAQVNEVLQGGSESAGAAREKVRAELDSGLGEWSLAIEEATVPDDAAYAGTSLHDLALPAKFGCSVVEIERNGFGILAPDSLSALYPGDRLLLLGKPDEIRAAHEFLSQTRASAMSKEGFSDAVLETCVVPVNGPYVDNTLANLQIARSTRVRIVGIRRGDTQLLNPTGTEALRAGDNLLLLGTPGRLRTFRTRLAGNP